MNFVLIMIYSFSEERDHIPRLSLYAVSRHHKTKLSSYSVELTVTLTLHFLPFLLYLTCFSGHKLIKARKKEDKRELIDPEEEESAVRLIITITLQS